MIWRILEVEDHGDNTLWDLHNSSDYKKAESNNCVIIFIKS